MRVVTANIRNNPDLARTKVRGDASAVGRMGGVALFQEIAEAEDHEDLTDGLGKPWTVIHRHVAVPVAYRRHRWEVATKLPNGVKSTGAIRTHNGRRRASPPRYVTWVVLRRKDRPDHPPVAFVNTHFVSGAWNRKPKLHKSWRKEMWNQHWKKMQEILLRFYAAGITVVFAGDFNKVKVPRFHEGQRWFINGGIDKMGCLEAPSGARIALREVDRKDLNSDHDARIARVIILKPRR
jgi:hypothetical protein